MQENRHIKVCVGLSGGVDSSVAALLLKQQGYDVSALFMQNWHDADATLHGDCEWEEDRYVAELVARRIGIPFHFVDLSKEYRTRVVDYMFREYAAGRTPNPDVLCNREIKFDAFWEAAKKLGADCVATGHYCRKAVLDAPAGQPLLDAHGRTWTGPDGNPLLSAGKPVYRILEGVDPDKDQSYFLCRLTQEQLSRALFPIGHLTKQEVRRIAHLADLPSADKKDSQGICFIGKVDLPTFLRQQLKPVEGDVVEVHDAYFAQAPQYSFIHDTLASLLEVPGEPLMVTEYASEDTGGRAFNNVRLASGAVSPPGRGPASGGPASGGPAGGGPPSGGPASGGPAGGGSAGRGPASGGPAGGGPASGDPVGRGPAGGGPADGGPAANTFSPAKIAALSDEQLLQLSRPVRYDDIQFESETYRSGKRHVKKTRWKDNPSGRIIGRHEGAQFYTIGQRKGLGIGGHKDSLFVIATDIPRNIIYVGEGHAHKGLSRSCIRIAPEDIHWIRTDLAMAEGEIRRYRVRIRYRQPLQDAWLIRRRNGLYLLFDTPQRGISPGQFAVWYAPDDEMLGSGTI